MGYGLGSLSAGSKAAMRTVVLASADADLRGRLCQQLTAMRWQVREAGGGADDKNGRQSPRESRYAVHQ